MNYSVINLSTVADCDALLNRANTEKADIQHARYSDLRLTVKYAQTSIALDTELQSVIVEIATYESIFPNLPEGPVKDDIEIKLEKAKHKKFLLEHRRESYGVIALLERERDVAYADRQLLEVDAFIEAIMERRDSL